MDNESLVKASYLYIRRKVAWLNGSGWSWSSLAVGAERMEA